MTNVFSVVALAIMFREALEAAIIISVMLQLCDRLALPAMKKIGTRLSRLSSRPIVEISSSSANVSFCLQCGLAHCWDVA